MLLIGRERGKEQIGKIPGESPDKSGKSRESPQKDKKRTKKEGQVQIGKPPRLKHPRLAALEIQKNPRVRKIRVRNSGAGNGCANFMDTWKKCLLSAGKTMSVKFLLLGGGGFGGGSADFYFYGRADFSDLNLASFPLEESQAFSNSVRSRCASACRCRQAAWPRLKAVRRQSPAPSSQTINTKDPPIRELVL